MLAMFSILVRLSSAPGGGVRAPSASGMKRPKKVQTAKSLGEDHVTVA
jgi:hypothetical protein